MGGIVIEMNVAGLSKDEAKRIVKEKLLNQWDLLDGDLSVITTLENLIYTPGTPKNTDFELVLLIPFKRFFLAKKNDALKKLLQNPSDFSNIISLTFVQVSSKGKEANTEIFAIKPDRNFAEHVDIFVEELFSKC